MSTPADHHNTNHGGTNGRAHEVSGEGFMNHGDNRHDNLHDAVHESAQGGTHDSVHEDGHGEGEDAVSIPGVVGEVIPLQRNRHNHPHDSDREQHDPTTPGWDLERRAPGAELLTPEENAALDRRVPSPWRRV